MMPTVWSGRIGETRLSSRAASFLYLVPPVALAVAFAWVDEIPSLLTVVGGAVTLAGVIVVNTLGRAAAP